LIVSFQKKAQAKQQQQPEMKKKYLKRDNLPGNSRFRSDSNPIEQRGTLAAKVIDIGFGSNKASYLKITNSAVEDPKKGMLSVPMTGLDKVAKLVNIFINNVGRYQTAIKQALENGTMGSLAKREEFFRWNAYDDSADVHVRKESVIGESGVATIHVILIFILYDREDKRFLDEPEPMISICKYPGSKEWERSVDVQGMDDLRLLQQLLGLFYNDQWEDNEGENSSSDEDDNDDDDKDDDDDDEVKAPVQIGGGRVGTGLVQYINQPGTSTEPDIVMVEDPEAPAAKKGRIVYRRLEKQDNKDIKELQRKLKSKNKKNRQ
jgi:hypothetical protein